MTPAIFSNTVESCDEHLYNMNIVSPGITCTLCSFSKLRPSKGDIMRLRFAGTEAVHPGMPWKLMTQNGGDVHYFEGTVSQVLGKPPADMIVHVQIDREVAS